MSSYRVLSVDDILAFPPITWLVQDIIPNGGLALLFGPPNIGKSFLALDLAHSIGTGLRWLGRRTQQGSVIYVAAGEGVPGLKARVQGWQLSREVAIENVVYGTDAVQLHQTASVNKFLKTVDAIEPALVVFDTLARCFVGGDEDKVKDMGQAIGAADEIRRRGCAVLFVHHTGHPDEEGHIKSRARGSSGLPAAVDTSMEVSGEKDSPTRTLWCRKQKDAEWFRPIQIEMQAVRRHGRSLTLVPSVAQRKIA